MISAEVILFQLLILASVICIGVIVGPKARLWAAIAWAIWTLFMVFTGWLFIFQFFVIFIAIHIGESFDTSLRLPAIQRALRMTLLWVVGLAIVGIGIAIYLDSQRPVVYDEPIKSSYIPYPTKTPISTAPAFSETPRVVDSNQNNMAEEPETQKIYKCSEKHGKKTSVTYQGFPCVVRN